MVAAQAVRGIHAQRMREQPPWRPERQLLQRTMDDTQQTVTGTVRLKLYKGNCIPVGRKSAQSLYQESFATFEEDEVYSQKDAEGFIRLNALRLKIQALRNRT